MNPEMVMRLKARTNQEAFDIVVRHLAQQTERAYDESEGSCTYLAPDGNRCAVGALFKANDDQLTAFLDVHNRWGSGIIDMIGDGSVKIGRVSERLLFLLQDVHDNAYFRTDGRFHAWDAMIDVAQEFGLDISAVEEVRLCPTP